MPNQLYPFISKKEREKSWYIRKNRAKSETKTIHHNPFLFSTRCILYEASNIQHTQIASTTLVHTNVLLGHLVWKKTYFLECIHRHWFECHVPVIVLLKKNCQIRSIPMTIGFVHFRCANDLNLFYGTSTLPPFSVRYRRNVETTHSDGPLWFDWCHAWVVTAPVFINVQWCCIQ